MTPKDILEFQYNPDLLIKKYFIDPKFCMAHNKHQCEGSIIKAHTISKQYIKNIEKNGHVYIPVGSSHNDHSFFEFRLEGIVKATHINGFCEFHDNELFQSFEKHDFTGTYKQIYDMSFRALARELYHKKCFSSLLSQGVFQKIDKTGYTQSSHFKDMIYYEGQARRDREFIYREIQKYKRSGLSYVLIETSKLPISTSGVFFPLSNPHGKKIQKPNKNQLGFMFNIISLKNKSYIIMSSVKSLHNNIHNEFLSSIVKLNPTTLINYFLTLTFFNNSNLIIDPDWFEQLPPDFKDTMNSLMNSQVGHQNEEQTFAEIEFSQHINFTVINTKLIT